LSPYSNNVGLCTAIEKIADIEVPLRAQYIRMIGCELARISSHLLWLGTMVMDSGAISMFIWTFRERERLYDIFDDFAGHRFTVSHSRIGGVTSDISETALKKIKHFVDTFPAELRDWNKLLNKNRIFYDRNLNVGTIDSDFAIGMGLTGANIRATGIAYDIRTFEPYMQYDKVD